MSTGIFPLRCLTLYISLVVILSFIAIYKFAFRKLYFDCELYFHVYTVSNIKKIVVKKT